jgi:hypothetical protein
MKRENYDLSYKKWNDKDGIVAEFQKPGRVDWGKVKELIELKCGHCMDSRCRYCSLFQPGLCHGKSENKIKGYFTLKDMAYGCSEAPRNKRTGRRIAERIFKAILKDEPKE